MASKKSDRTIIQKNHLQTVHELLRGLKFRVTLSSPAQH
jgi:hypothetical protein